MVRATAAPALFPLPHNELPPTGVALSVNVGKPSTPMAVRSTTNLWTTPPTRSTTLRTCRYPEDRVPPHTSSKSRQGAWRASMRCRVRYSFGPHLPAEVGFGAATCHKTTSTFGTPGRGSRWLLFSNNFTFSMLPCGFTPTDEFVLRQLLNCDRMNELSQLNNSISTTIHHPARGVGSVGTACPRTLGELRSTSGFTTLPEGRAPEVSRVHFALPYM
jgi:hypothetical protein